LVEFSAELREEQDLMGPANDRGEQAAALRAPWIDHRLQSTPRKPWRKIHLDYHNTPFVGAVGHGFDPEEFIGRLRLGHADSIVVFAKDMHGYFYFPSKRGPVHPGLERDLLGEQVAACRKAGIAVYAYYCVTWDNVMALEHPEWLVFRRDRTTYLPRFDEVPGWTGLCLTNQDYVEVMLGDSREILSDYELDGMWYDMPKPIDGECFCRNCLAAIRDAGGDPFDEATQRNHKQELQIDFLRAARELVDEVRPGCQIDQNNQTRLGLSERVAFVDNIDVEAPPTYGWGYGYFPVDVRYARGFGKSVCGLTGRFHQSWADFGGLKHPRQLAVEIAGIVAQGAHCSVGDQPPPSGRLDKAVYQMIGEVYSEVERLQDLLDQAAPVVEAAIVVDGVPMLDPGAVEGNEMPQEGVGRLGAGVVGAAELLVEHRVQFDVIEVGAEFDHYRLLIVPDGFEVNPELAGRLQRYVEKGGALIALGGAAGAAGEDSWLPGLGIKVKGESPFKPAFLVPGEGLEGVLAPYEYALYDGTWEWSVDESDGVEIWARVGVPFFQRSPEHYTSHRQTPFEHVTDLAAVVRSGRVAAASFDLGAAYNHTGYWPYRVVFGKLLDAVLPERLVRSDAPHCAEISLTQQITDKGERFLVHVVNGATGRRWGERFERFEDPITLSDIRISLDLPVAIERAWLGGTGEAVELRAVTAQGASHLVEIELASLDTASIVVLEPAAS
jgi:hypothetical protein